MRRKVKVKERTKDYIVKDQCRHYWVIEMAHGPTSRGFCQYCGEVRDFLNVIPDFTTLKRKDNPLDLPELSDIELDEDSRS